MRYRRMGSLLNAPCDFPQCPCGPKLAFWQERLEEWLDEARPPPTWMQTAWARVALSFVFACVRAHARDAEARAFARRELSTPTFEESVVMAALNQMED